MILVILYTDICNKGRLNFKYITNNIKGDIMFSNMTILYR